MIEWISVEDRLPEPCETVLVRAERNDGLATDYFAGWYQYDKDKWYSYYFNHLKFDPRDDAMIADPYKVTHWAEINEPDDRGLHAYIKGREQIQLK